MIQFSKIAVAAALLCAGSAMAQSTATYNPSWYIAPSLSLFDADSRFGVNERGEGASLKFGKPVSQFWDIQTGMTYARTTRPGFRTTQRTAALDGLYMFSRQSIRPFALFGIGAEMDKIDTPNFQRKGNSPFLSAGLGMQMDLNDRWSIQADVRHVRGFLSQNDFGFKQSKANYLNVGLNYVLDKPVQKVVARAPEPMPAPVVVAAPPPAPTPAPPPAPRFERITLSNTELFTFDSAVLVTPQPKLDQIAAVLKSAPNAGNINVVGHADRLGSDSYNLALSGRRAESVKVYLVNQGVSPNRLFVVAKGESEPVVTCNDRNRVALIKCLEPNRRVVIEEITIERRVN